MVLSFLTFAILVLLRSIFHYLAVCKRHNGFLEVFYGEKTAVDVPLVKGASPNKVMLLVWFHISCFGSPSSGQVI